MEICSTCQKPKAGLHCGLCQQPVCKSCAHILGEERFAFHPSPPAELKTEISCEACYQDKVAPLEQEYEETLELAREVLVFNKSQSKESRLIPRKEVPVRVQDVDDEQEALMHLAFQAARRGCNAVVDVDLQPKKVRDGSYQTTLWSGTAIPARVDAERYANRVERKNPN
jgi:hypothetical protein